ncbi:unnamed protein product [Arctogadus glacialis]
MLPPRDSPRLVGIKATSSEFFYPAQMISHVKCSSPPAQYGGPLSDGRTLCGVVLASPQARTTSIPQH